MCIGSGSGPVMTMSIAGGGCMLQSQWTIMCIRCSLLAVTISMTFCCGRGDSSVRLYTRLIPFWRTVWQHDFVLRLRYLLKTTCDTGANWTHRKNGINCISDESWDFSRSSRSGNCPQNCTAIQDNNNGRFLVANTRQNLNFVLQSSLACSPHVTEQENLILLVILQSTIM